MGGSTIKRSSYALAGQVVAFRVAGDPVTTNNGLFFIYGDHLGSTSVLQKSGDTQHLAGSLTRYRPFGSYRTAPTQTITDRDFTGQRENRELGLLYYNARFYHPASGRFISPDFLVPSPSDPQSLNRYSYVRNSPVNLVDPSGHVDCKLLDSERDSQSCQSGKTNAGTSSSACKVCGSSSQYGAMGAAYDVFAELEKELGRAVTYEEVLALVAYHEFGSLEIQEEYDVALEAMGRQFYNACGETGICQGAELWQFLGSQQGWYQGNGKSFAAELTDGTVTAQDFAGAQRVLNQPAYHAATATDAEKRANWRSSDQVGGVPFKYGNYSMFPMQVRPLLADEGRGIYGNGATTIYFNHPDSQYTVMTITQYNYWVSLQP
ncbi:MAG: RHS repeat-associated core domain-containing protein [Chloroflexota bacterium]